MNDYRKYSDYLMHYGRKGMKWGENRFEQDKPLRSFNSAIRNLNRKTKRSGQSKDTGQGNNGNNGNQGNLLDKLAQFGSDTIAEAQRRGNAAQEAGNIIAEMISNKEYTRAFTYYDSLDEETKKIVNDHVIKTMLPEALGNGDIRLGRQRVEQGKEIFSRFWNNPVASFARRTASNGFNRVTGNDIRINTDIDLHDPNRRKRINQ